MYTFKHKNHIINFLLLLSLNVAFADNINSSDEYFVSNNTNEIDLQTAYKKLQRVTQSDLQNSIVEVMQKNHIEQGKFENILGTYQMSSDKNITADNTLHFITSPEQNLSNEKVFSLAKELAIKLNQDSVAVLIPNQSDIGDITVSFTSHQPSINELINMLHQKLPKLYNQAYSLHLTNTCGNFKEATVTEVEWLGSKINLEIIKKAFPSEKINFHHGTVFLVYPDGHKEQL